MAEATKKLAGKYESPEALEKAYLELQETLGKQGTELGELKKGFATYQEWATKATPIVEWYSKTFQPHADKFDAYLKGGSAGAGNVTVAAADAQARAAVAGTAGYDWLTPQEKQALVADIRGAILNDTLKPWTDSFTKQAQEFANTLTSRFDTQHKSFTDVLWRTFERVMPKDKVDEIKAWHSAALRFADPSKIDPMTMGDEFMGLTADKVRLEGRVKELEDQRTSYEKSQVPGLFGSPSPDTAAPNDTAVPTSREDRLKAVMGDVVAAHGTEGARTLFDAPSLTR